MISRVSRYLFIMGILVSIWSFPYGIMGITSDYGIASFMRVFIMIGVDGFLLSELFFYAGYSTSNRTFVRAVEIFFFVYSVFDVIFFSSSDVCEFTRIGERTCYYGTEAWQWSFHLIYVLVVIIGLLSFWVICWKNAINYRERRSLIIILVSNLFLIISSIPDTVLPIAGIPSWPSSAIGGLIAFLMMDYAENRYRPFDITGDVMYKYIFKYSDVGFMAIGLDGHIVCANEYARNLIGISEDDSTSMIEDFFDISDEEKEEYFYNIESVSHVECKVKTHNDTNIMLSMKLEYDENHLPYCIFATVVDLTKEEQMVNKLYEADEAKTKFLFNMSHEIRTPVNTLLGMNEMIIRKNRDPRIAGYANSIKSACNLLISIINDILDFSKIESGEIELSENEYSLRELVNNLVQLIEDRTRKKGLSLEVSIDENLPERLYGDEVRVRQIVTNILTNAVKYTDHGRITLSMKGYMRSADMINLRIDVIDTGKGIRKEDQAKLFTEFSRVDEKRNRHIEGTGLGLSIASHYVSLMGGSISVDSVYGKGSDFYIIIPQKIMSDKSIGKFSVRDSNEVQDKNNTASFVAPNARILVVDDNEMNLTVARLLLQDTRMQIDIAESGRSALEKMNEGSYDLILLDHMMPEMDGIELLKIMKNEGIQEGVPVIVLTANALSGSREMYLENGFDDYLSKPIEIAKMNAMLRKWLKADLIEECREVKRV